MSDTLTIRVPVPEKAAWQTAAEAVHEQLSEFARNAIRQRVAQVEQKGKSPWDKYIGKSATPPGFGEATNANIRRYIRAKHGKAHR